MNLADGDLAQRECNMEMHAHCMQSVLYLQCGTHGTSGLLHQWPQCQGSAAAGRRSTRDQNSRNAKHGNWHRPATLQQPQRPQPHDRRRGPKPCPCGPAIRHMHGGEMVPDLHRRSCACAAQQFSTQRKPSKGHLGHQGSIKDMTRGSGSTAILAILSRAYRALALASA